MEITLNISEKLLRKIKALSTLEESSIEGFESRIVESLEETISQKIVQLAMGEQEPILMPFAHTTQPARTVAYSKTETITPDMDYSQEAVVSGLGDEDDEDDEDVGVPVDAFDLIPETGGLSDDAIEKDMKVEDPDTEAIGSEYTAPEGTNSESSPEDLFSSTLKIDPPAQTHMIDPRVARKKKHHQDLAKTRKAKVFAATNIPSR